MTRCPTSLSCSFHQHRRATCRSSGSAPRRPAGALTAQSPLFARAPLPSPGSGAPAAWWRRRRRRPVPGRSPWAKPRRASTRPQRSAPPGRRGPADTEVDRKKCWRTWPRSPLDSRSTLDLRTQVATDNANTPAHAKLIACTYPSFNPPTAWRASEFVALAGCRRERDAVGSAHRRIVCLAFMSIRFFRLCAPRGENSSSRPGRRTPQASGQIEGGDAGDPSPDRL